MAKVLRVELKRGFSSLGTMISMLLGIACIAYKNFYLIRNELAIKRMLAKLPEKKYIPVDTKTFYHTWIVGYLDSTNLYLFYFLGIIVALPFGISYYMDKKNGYIKNICTRIGKQQYLRAKYLSVFITGGTVAFVPVFIDFLLAKLQRPHTFLRIAGTGLRGHTWWGVFIIDHLYLSAVIIMAVWFLFGGVLAVFSLLISYIADNLLTIQLTPFFVMLILFYLPGMFPARYMRYFPYYFLTIFDRGTPLIALTEIVPVMVITYTVFVTIEKRKDVL